jgi:hypothetical protein
VNIIELTWKGGSPQIHLVRSRTSCVLDEDRRGACQHEIEEYTFHALYACTREYVRQLPDSGASLTVLIHLKAAALDREDMAAPLRGISRFLVQDRDG